jgi:hypothetical protein
MNQEQTILNGGLPGHESGTFGGPFDIFMDFAFYIPTLMACELYFFAQRRFSETGKQVALGACPRIELVLRESRFETFFAVFSGE